MMNSTTPYHYHLIKHDDMRDDTGEVPTEKPVTIFVNGQELATFMCTPTHIKAMALGFLLNEGIIARHEDVRVITMCKHGGCVDLWLDSSLPVLSPQRITTGCAGGVTFEKLKADYPPLTSKLTVGTTQLHALMHALYGAADVHKLSGGVHTSALAQEGKLRHVVEDIGRHNTLDKLRGLAFLEGIETRDNILLTTGRISSDMLSKARRMQTPIVVSRSSPTSLSVAMARAWNITLVGYLRRNRMTAYAHPWRLETGNASPPPL